MRRTDTTQILAALALTLLLIVIDITTAQDPEDPALQPPSGMSGKVVDAEGNPIAGFTFSIQPMHFRDGEFLPEAGFPQFQRPPEGIAVPGMPRAMRIVKTEPDGTFTVPNIRPGPVQLNAVSSAMLERMERFDPEKIRQGEQPPPEIMHLNWMESDMEILSIQIGKVTFFYKGERHMPAFMKGLTFALKPGVPLENVEITVKSRLRFRARIVYADETPVVNTHGHLRMRRGEEHNPRSGGTHGTDFLTDADGFFTKYIDEPGFYTFSVNHNALSGGAGPVLIKDGVAPENIVITLDGNPVGIKPNVEQQDGNLPAIKPNVEQQDGADDKIERNGAGNVVIKETKVTPKVRVRPAVPLRPPIPQRPKSVWIINPANGHAYKKIQCSDWHDAQRQAVAEGAHIVSINDEAEQHWLQVIFKLSDVWIGLTDLEKEGKWQWDSGEPVTYTNWTAQPMFGDEGRPETEKDYVVMTFHRNGQWQSVGPKSHFWRSTRHAIIEKDGLISKAPATEKSGDE